MRRSTRGFFFLLFFFNAPLSDSVKDSNREKDEAES